MKETTKEKTAKSGKRVKFFIDKDSGLIHAAVIFMALSAVFRLVGCWGLWADKTFAVMQIALPVLCALLFIALLLLLGRRAFWLSSVPVILGAVFFIVRAVGFNSWVYTLVAILACLVITMLYTATAFGFVRTKWFVLPLIALVFLYKLCVADVAALKNSAVPVSFASGMQEISVLCVLLALFFTVLAMRKRLNIEEMQLPKIKDPKPLIKKKAPEPPAQTGENADSAENTQTENGTAPAEAANAAADTGDAAAADGADKAAENEPAAQINAE